MAATVKFYNTDVRPATDLLLDLGTALFRWNNLYVLNANLGGLTYTWPTAHVAGFLKNNGSGTLTWASADPTFVGVAKWGAVTL